MDFRMLGPLEVVGPAGPLPLGAGKPRLLLAALLVEAGSPVSTDRLIDVLWGDRPPPSATNALQVHVSQLRRILSADGGQLRLVTRPPGYLLAPLDGEVDAGRFSALATVGQQQLLRQDATLAAATLREALAQWRGPVLADLPDARFAAGEAARLEALRLQALADRIEADLGRGRHAEVLAELDQLVAEHPLDERFVAHQMIALYRAGRQVDALAAFRAARRRLVDAAGVEPGPQLRDLERAILQQDTMLDLPAHVAVSPPVRRERRLVSVVAVDLSTAGAAASTDEDSSEHDHHGAADDVAAEGLAAARARVRRLLAEAGGTDIRSVGLIEVASFGSPTALGDDAMRALRCAVELGAPAAVATGTVVTGLDGDGDDSGGQVLDRAVRLLVTHHRGVVTDAATRAAARPGLSFAPEPGVRDDGLPVAWRVVGAAPTARTSVPLVGRAAELAALTVAWRRAMDGHVPQLVTVSGVPGIGKSRLAEEFSATVASSGGQVVAGRALPYDGQGAYLPVALQLRTLAGVRPEDPPSTAVRRLTTLAESLQVPDARAVADQVALLVGWQQRDTVADRLSLFYSARVLAAATAAARPTMLVFEDLHWADDSTLDLVEHLAARVRDVPLLLLVLARPELYDRRPTWGSATPEHASITLQPLDDKDTRSLSSLLLGTASDDDRAVLVARRSEGNPLFVEELATAATDGDAAALPGTVRLAIAARLDALPPASRAFLIECAVMGRRFWPAAVAAPRPAQDTDSAPDPRDVDHLVDDLDRRDLIRRDDLHELPGQEQYLFRHMLIREVAYDLMPVATRRQGHAAVAAFIETAAGSRASEHAGLLALHWREAGRPDQARRWFLVAAEQARRSWAKGEAIAALDEALALLPPGDPAETGIRLERSHALVENGQYADAAEELDLLLPRLDAAVMLPALLARAKAAWWLEDAAGVRRLARRIEREARLRGRPERSAPAVALLSQVAGMEGRPRDLIDQGQRALAVWESDQAPAERAYHMELVGLAQTWVGDYSAAEKTLEDAYDAARQCHSVEAMIRAGASVGLALAGRGRHEQALARLQQIVALGRELELVPRFTGRALNMTSMVLREVLDLDSARRCNEEADELGRRAAFLLVRVQAGIDLLFADLVDGDVAAAADRLPLLWQRTEQARGFHQWLMAGRLLVAEAEIAVAREQWEDALACAQRARDAARSTGRTKHEIAAIRAAAHGLAHTDRAAAERAVGQALAMAQNLGHPPTTWSTAAQAAALLAYLGRQEASERAAELARSSARGFVATLSPERQHTFRTHRAVAHLIGQ